MRAMLYLIARPVTGLKEFVHMTGCPCLESSSWRAYDTVASSRGVFSLDRFYLAVKDMRIRVDSREVISCIQAAILHAWAIWFRHHVKLRQHTFSEVMEHNA